MRRRFDELRAKVTELAKSIKGPVTSDPGPGFNPKAQSPAKAGGLWQFISETGKRYGLTVNKKWFALPFVVQAFFFQHALQGWCPPIPILRRLGVRTTAEIAEERNALKAMRGDFESVWADKGEGRAKRAFQAAQR